MPHVNILTAGCRFLCASILLCSCLRVRVKRLHDNFAHVSVSHILEGCALSYPGILQAAYRNVQKATCPHVWQSVMWEAKLDGSIEEKKQDRQVSALSKDRAGGIKSKLLEENNERAPPSTKSICFSLDANRLLGKRHFIIHYKAKTQNTLVRKGMKWFQNEESDSLF